ncbi:MAG: hypothetical protein ACFFDF_03945 [Candidatus Odinarchaeota archaeon]
MNLNRKVGELTVFDLMEISEKEKLDITSLMNSDTLSKFENKTVKEYLNYIKQRVNRWT